MKYKIGTNNYIILTALASTSLYIIFRNLPSVFGSFMAFWTPITLLVIFISRPGVFLKSNMKLLYLYGIISIGILQYTLWKYMSEWNRIRVLYEYIYFIVFTSVLNYYVLRKEYHKLAWIGKWTFIFILITLVTTNIALFFFPTIVRDSANTSDFSTLQNRIYNYLGSMDYSYAQAIICLIPVLAFNIKNNRILVFKPQILKLILILIIITELRSQVFANILVTLIITGLSFINRSNKKALLAFSILGILIISLPSYVYSNLFYSLSTFFSESSVLNAKLSSLSEFILNPEINESTDLGARAERYPLLFNALMTSPLMGYSSYHNPVSIAAGAHLFWMNRLTIWGIPGFLFFIFILYRLLKSISSGFDNDFRYFYKLSVFSICILGLAKAVGGREPWLLLIVVIPGLYYFPLLENSKRKLAIQ